MTSEQASPKRIFISSPSDVQAEREAAERVLSEIEAEREGAVAFEVVRWEHSHYSAAKTFQDAIPPTRECDLVVCIFFSRLGMELPRHLWEEGPRTGSQFEFETALAAAKEAELETGKALPDIFVYRRRWKLELTDEDLDRATQNKQLLEAFFQRWFHSDEGHYVAAYTTYDEVKEFAERFRRAVLSWLDEEQRGTWDPSVPPFRGLSAYDARYERMFFGRRRAVREGLAKLRAAAARGVASLIILGASGVGKSSLVGAGLVPRLTRAGGLDERDHVRALAFKPASLSGTDGPFLPLAELLLGRTGAPGLPEMGKGAYANPARLARLLAGDPDAAVAQFEEAQFAWADVLQAQLQAPERPPVCALIVVDQLEEVFDFPADERERLLALLALLARTPGFVLLSTVRSDFYGALQASPVLRALKDEGATLDLLGPSEREIAEIVDGPARLAGLEYERAEVDGEARSLRDELIDATTPDALPLLSFTLDELWRRREGTALRLTDYDALGGLQGAIARRAEETFAALMKETGESEVILDRALRRVLRRMVETRGEGDVGARPFALSVFAEGTPEQRLVDRFAAARLFALEQVR